MSRPSGVAATPVLVADDEEGLRDLLRYELSAQGYAVTVASDGAKAIALLAEQRFRLVICDVRMPRAGGLEVLEAAKLSDPATEVILATGFADIAVAVEAMKKGAYDFVQKPLDVEQLLLLASKALEKAELRARLAAQEAETVHTLGMMAAGVAHDLNNPLSSVLGFTELALGHAGLPPQARADLGVVLEHARRCKAIVTNLLEFARRSPLRRDPVSLEEVVHGALGLLGSEVQRSGAQLALSLPKTETPVRGDAVALQRLIVNLASNALHAMEGAPRRILSLAVRRQGASAVLEVSDSGCGIAADDLDKIFRPFYTTKEHGKGTGLGLAICRTAALQHEGDISVTSRPGAGTTFTVKLPLLEAARATP